LGAGVSKVLDFKGKVSVLVNGKGRRAGAEHEG
jgi:hypothetical protein